MFTTEIQPRLSETDGLRHINNTVLPAWFEEAREGIFRIFNPTLGFDTWNLILKKFEIDIVKQITRDPIVVIESGIGHIGSSSFVTVQTARQNGDVVAVGKTVLIYFDYKTQQPAPIPDAIRPKLDEHRVAEEAG
jgi:acyl-CoA thioester hydrolase